MSALTDRMADEAREHLRRSIGQQARRAREAIEAHAKAAIQPFVTQHHHKGRVVFRKWVALVRSGGHEFLVQSLHATRDEAIREAATQHPVAELSAVLITAVAVEGD